MERGTAQFENNKTLTSTIKLNVGGHPYITSLATLRQYPDTMLAVMFSGRHTLLPEADGAYFIDRDGTHFRYILNLLRSPETCKVVRELPLSVQEEIKCECDYYGLIDLMFPCQKPFTCLNCEESEVEVTQDEQGHFCIDETPIAVCPYCGTANYSACCTGYVLGNPNIVSFRRIVLEMGGKVLPSQPTPDRFCYKCGKI